MDLPVLILQELVKLELKNGRVICVLGPWPEEMTPEPPAEQKDAEGHPLPPVPWPWPITCTVKQIRYLPSLHPQMSGRFQILGKPIEGTDMWSRGWGAYTEINEDEVVQQHWGVAYAQLELWADARKIAHDAEALRMLSDEDEEDEDEGEDQGPEAPPPQLPTAPFTAASQALSEAPVAG